MSAEVIHSCPPDGSGITPCCGEMPFDLPRTDRIALDPSLVTCHACLACSDLDHGPCTCRQDCGHLCCTRGIP